MMSIDSYNERQVAKRAESTVAELIDELERNRDVLIGAVESAGDDDLDTEVLSAGGFRGPLAMVLYWVAVDHVRGHLNDILQTA